MDDAINGQPRAGAFAMRVLPVILFSFFATAAVAGEATPAATPATAVASEGASQPQLKSVGRLNVNTATRRELSAVPGLDPVAIEAILEARTTSPISDLARIAPITAQARLHLKTEGPSNFYRVLQLPLERLAPVSASSVSRR
ncbi:MAG TPA: hypothetical protein VII38_22620 [Polyangia bacterium]